MKLTVELRCMLLLLLMLCCSVTCKSQGQFQRVELNNYSTVILIKNCISALPSLWSAAWQHPALCSRPHCDVDFAEALAAQSEVSADTHAAPVTPNKTNTHRCCDRTNAVTIFQAYVLGHTMFVFSHIIKHQMIILVPMKTDYNINANRRSVNMSTRLVSSQINRPCLIKVSHCLFLSYC